MSVEFWMFSGVLLFGAVIILGITMRIERDQLPSVLSSNSLVIFSAMFFVTLMVGIYLFDPTEWIADILKVSIGLVAGLTAGVAGSSINQSIQGNNNFQALDAKINSIDSDITDVKNAVIDKLDTTQNLVVDGFERFQDSRSMKIPLSREVFRYRIGEEILSSDAQEALRTKLSSLDGLRGYPEAFFTNEGFRKALKEFLRELPASDVYSVNCLGWDNISDGIEFYFRVDGTIEIEGK